MNLSAREGVDDFEFLELQKIGVGGIDGTDSVLLHEGGGTDIEEEVSRRGMQATEERG